MQRAVTALLGPTNTGKTYLAIERMLDAPDRDDRLPAAAAGAGELRPRRGAAGAGGGRARHRRGAHRPAEAVLLDVHGRGDAPRPEGGLPRRGRGPARRRPRARPRLHRPHPARAGPPRDVAPRRRDHPAAPPPAPARTRPSPRGRGCRPCSYAEPKRLGKLPPRSAVIVFSVRELYEVAARLRREQGGAALVFGALSPRTRNAQVGLYQAGEVDLPGGDRRHRHGPQPRHRPRRLHRPHQVRRRRPARRSPRPRWARSRDGPGRHVRDGHFAPTDRARALRPAPRRRGREAPLRAPRRTSTGGPTTSTSSRRSRSSAASTATPPHPFLVRMRHAEDQRRSPRSPATPEVDGARPRRRRGAAPLGGLPGARTSRAS